MFDYAELTVFSCGDFHILKQGDDSLMIKSKMTGHLWFIKKFDEDGYPPMVLYHSHHKALPFHVHCVYDNENALHCYAEIINHDKLITKRMELRNKLTTLNNQQLVDAVFA